MVRLLVHWIIAALAVWITSLIVPGFILSNAVSALIAAVVIGFVNSTIGLFIKIITLPFTIVTLGIFWLLINAVMLELASAFVPGFYIRSFGTAFWGAIVLSAVNMLLKWAVIPPHRL